MRFILILKLVGLSAWAFADFGFQPDQFGIRSEPLPLTVTAVTDWVVALKKQVNGGMLDEHCRFTVALRAQGDLTADQRHALTYQVEVREVEQAPRVYAALFYSRRHMNSTLIRPSIFQDGGPGLKAGTLPQPSTVFYHQSMEACRGVNLKGTALKAFYEQSRKLSSPLNPEEDAFYRYIAAPLFALHPDGDFYLVGTNVVGFSMDTFGHELAHAYFNNVPQYRKAVIQFWSEQVSSEDKEKITGALAGIYDSENAEVIVDEFQAYLLQPMVAGAQSDLLRAFVPTYRAHLLQRLTQENVAPPFAE